MGLLSRKDNKQNELISKLRSEIDNENYDVLEEGFYEWQIKKWDKLSNVEYSSEFNVANHNWILKLYQNKEKDDNNKDYISFYLINTDIVTENSNKKFIKCIYYIRNYKDYSNYHYQIDYKFHILNKNNDNSCGFPQFIEKAKLQSKSSPYLYNNKCIFGVFIRTYKYDKDQLEFLNKMKSIIVNDDKEVCKEGFYEWKIKKWNELGTYKLSPTFYIGDCAWHILLYKTGYRDNVTLCLNNIYVGSTSYNHLKFCTKHVFYIRNYKNYSNYYYKHEPVFYNFNKNNNDFSWGGSQTISESLIEDNKCVIGVYIRIYKQDYEQLNFINEMKILTADNDNEIVDQGYFEWILDDFNKIHSFKQSNEINISDSTWYMTLKKKDNNFVFYLNNEDAEDDDQFNICAKYLFYVRNYKNYSNYEYKYVSKFQNFNMSNKSVSWGDSQPIKDSLIEDNKCIVGVYLCTYKQNHEQIEFNDKIKKLIDNEDNEVLDEGYYEWKIEDWNSIPTYQYSPVFDVANYKWKLLLFPNGKKESYNNECVSFYLNSIDGNNDDSTYIHTKRVYYIRNYHDYSCYKYQISTGFYTFQKKSTNVSSGFGRFIEKSDLFVPKGNSNNCIVENNKCILGVFIRTYRYNDEQMKLYKQIKTYVDDEGCEIIGDGLYEWKIDQWNKMPTYKYSPEFHLVGHKWKLLLYPNGNGENNKGHVSFYVESIDANRDPNTNIYVKRVYYIRNYNDPSCFHYLRSMKFYTFKKKSQNTLSGQGQMIKNSDLYNNQFTDANKPLVENNKCIFGIYIRTYVDQDEQNEFINEIKGYIGHDDQDVIAERFFEWKINNWYQLPKCINSPEFIASNYKWKLILYPKGKYVSIYLDNLDIKNNDSLNICTKSVYFIRNYYDYSTYDYNKENDFQVYSKRQGNVLPGISEFMSESDVQDIMEDTNKLVVGVYLCIYKYEKGKDKNEEEENSPINVINECDKDAESDLKEKINLQSADNNSQTTEEEIEERDPDEKGELAIAQFNFNAQDIDHLDIVSGQYYRILNRNIKDGWAFGYKSGQSQKKGIFPMAFVTICAQNNNNSTDNPSNINENRTSIISHDHTNHDLSFSSSDSITESPPPYSELPPSQDAVIFSSTMNPYDQPSPQNHSSSSPSQPSAPPYPLILKQPSAPPSSSPT